MILCVGPIVASANENSGGTNLQHLITTAKTEADLIGVGAVVLKNGNLLEAATIGQKQFETGFEIDLDERWHIGSITKSMTATMLARLVEQGELDWDDTIEDILGPQKIHKKWHDVTFRELLTHTSGAKPNFSIWTKFILPSTDEETLSGRKKHVRKTLKKKPKNEPAKGFAYSNVGYTIAGHLAEVKMGKSWENLMREEVFEPLGLESAGFGPPKPRGNEAVAWGHRGDEPLLPDEFADNSAIIGPAGAVHMTLQDLAKFGQAHIEGLAGRSEYLSKTSFEILHTPKFENYAMGWIEPQKSLFPETKVFWHNGSNTYWYALLYVVPDENMVYALATNSGKISEADKAFATLMQTHFKNLKDTEK